MQIAPAASVPPVSFMPVSPTVIEPPPVSVKVPAQVFVVVVEAMVILEGKVFSKVMPVRAEALLGLVMVYVKTDWAFVAMVAGEKDMVILGGRAVGRGQPLMVTVSI